MNELPHPRNLGEFMERVRNLCAMYDMSVSSGFRTEQRNEEVGGKPGSKHRLESGGMAVDAIPDEWVDRVMERFYAHAKKLGLFVVLYPDRKYVHIQGLPVGD